MKQENHGAIDNQQLIAIIERIERLNADAAQIASDIKEVYNDAKCEGFDVKYIREMIRLRKLDREELESIDELTSMYRTAVGL